jgi:hypothetical protein
MVDSMSTMLKPAAKPGNSHTVNETYAALQNLASTAERIYTSAAVRCAPDVEVLRDECLKKLSDLQCDVATAVANPAVQQQMWGLLNRQAIAAFQATTPEALKLVSLTLQQIEAHLKSYCRDERHRHRVRIGAVAVSVATPIAIAVALRAAAAYGIDARTAVPIIGIPTCVLAWSAIGSFAAILYRFTNSGDHGLEDPLRWLISRPLTGIVMGAIAFLVMKAGLMTIDPGAAAAADASATGNKHLGDNELVLLIAFLAGFSDRFADGLLRSVVGRFGTDNRELVSGLPAAAAAPLPTIEDFTSLLDKQGVPPVTAPPAPISTGAVGATEPNRSSAATRAAAAN